MADKTKQEELAQALKKLRAQAEEREAEKMANELGYPYLTLRQTSVMIDALKLIPEDEARLAQMAAIQIQARNLALIALDPRISEAKKILEDLGKKGYALKIYIGTRATLEEAWTFYRMVPQKASPITGKIEIEKEYFEGLLKNLTTLKAVKQEIEGFDFRKFATAKLVQIIMAGALSNRVSDIHLETQEKETTVRYRVDGVLHDVTTTLSFSIYHSLLTRVKLLSNMKLNVHDQAQDGRFTISMPTKEVEMRVSIIPSEFGENVVMRVLDPDAVKVKLEDLGMRPDIYKIAVEEINKPFGLILNTGPTGSGKTTTLYAFLRAVASPEIKIITVEDPIEYRLEGIEQTQVNAERGYTFANGLRSILRQDPDDILIGEIRDQETAEIALQAALTGHIVFSTLHTNDAIGAVPRLMDLGVKPMVIGPALSLVIAQRLVRKLCPFCKNQIKIDADLRKKIGNFLESLPSQVDRASYKEIKIFEAAGCEKCNDTGYKGRIALFEFFLGGKDLEVLISNQFTSVDLQNLAKKQGMVSLQEDGILKIISGITTFKEVEYVTGTLKL